MQLLSIIKKFAARAGIDGAIRNLLIGRLWSVAAGPLTVFFIAHFLGKTEQGYYYTFFSVQGLQLFFELGVSLVIMQFASHEAAGLEWQPDGTIQGDKFRKSRLASLLRIAVKWYGVSGLICAAGLLAGGAWFFGNTEGSASVDWKFPWILIACATGLNLFITPFYSILEGCGKIREMFGLLALQGVLGSLLLWLALGLGAGLYAAAVPLLTNICFLGTCLFLRYRSFFRDLWRHPPDPAAKVSWRRELFPLQWKIAVSSASGFFIFQLINPVIFRYHGAVAAGQFGMTQRIVDSIQHLSYSWVSAKAAVFGNCFASARFAEMMVLFRKSFRQSIMAGVAGSIAFLCLLYGLSSWGFAISERFLPPVIAICLCANMITNVAVFAIATLVRAEKREPFLIPSLIGAAIIPVIVFTVGVRGGPGPLAIGICSVNFLLGLPIALWILSEFKRRHLRSAAV